MCFSKELSLTSFIVGLSTSLLLLLFGNKKYKAQNCVLSLFIIWVSLMQLIDFAIWNDLDCKKGYNKIATIVGYLLNYSQPIVFLALLMKYLKLKSQMLLICSGLYAMLLLYNYVIYLKTTKFCVAPNCKSKTETQHLKWNWFNSDKNNNYLGIVNMIGYNFLFLLIFLVVILTFPFVNYKYIAISCLIIMSILAILMLTAFFKLKYDVNKCLDMQYNFETILEMIEKYSVGEVWCYFAPFVVIVILFLQKFTHI